MSQTLGFVKKRCWKTSCISISSDKIGMRSDLCFCFSWTTDRNNWLYKNESDEPLLCGNVTGSRHCPKTHTCLCVGENPNHGYTSFDNFLWSMLTTFQLITLDYWENVYNMVKLFFIKKVYLIIFFILGLGVVWTNKRFVFYRSSIFRFFLSNKSNVGCGST